MPSYDETQAKMKYEIALYRQQLSLIQKEMQRITMTTAELGSAQKTVKELSERDALIPIGGGSYIKAKLTEKRVIMPIGAQYLVEMENEEAESEIQRRIDATKQAVEKLGAEFEKISVKLEQIGPNLQQIENASAIDKRVEEQARDDYI